MKLFHLQQLTANTLEKSISSYFLSLQLYHFARCIGDANYLHQLNDVRYGGIRERESRSRPPLVITNWQLTDANMHLIKIKVQGWFYLIKQTTESTNFVFTFAIITALETFWVMRFFVPSSSLSDWKWIFLRLIDGCLFWEPMPAYTIRCKSQE